MIAVQLFVNGLIAGSIYALVASGFSLIYATNRFVHFAHGTTVTVGAYMLFTFFSLLGLNFFIAAFCTVVSTGLLGLLMFLLIYRPLKQRKSSNAILLVASIGLMIFLENLMLLLFGADVKTLAYIPVRKGIELWGAIITPLQIVIIATALLLLCLYGYLPNIRNVVRRCGQLRTMRNWQKLWV